MKDYENLWIIIKPSVFLSRNKISDATLGPLFQPVSLLQP
jgi:hypothetical protein